MAFLAFSTVFYCYLLLSAAPIHSFQLAPSLRQISRTRAPVMTVVYPTKIRTVITKMTESTQIALQKMKSRWIIRNWNHSPIVPQSYLTIYYRKSVTYTASLRSQLILAVPLMISQTSIFSSFLAGNCHLVTSIHNTTAISNPNPYPCPRSDAHGNPHRIAWSASSLSPFPAPNFLPTGWRLNCHQVLISEWKPLVSYSHARFIRHQDKVWLQIADSLCFIPF